MSKKIIYSSILIFLMVVVSGLIFYSGYLNKLRLINGHVDTETTYVGNFFKTFESQDTKALSATLDGILQDPGFKEVFLRQDREELDKYGQPLFQKLRKGYGITHFYFMLPDGTTFLRLHNSKVFGDLNNRITFKKAVDSKEVGFGIELGKTAFALRVVKPYYDGDKLIGYLELGQEIDHFLQVLKEETRNEYAIFVNKEKLNPIDWEALRKNNNKMNNWDSFSKMISTNSTVDLENNIDEQSRFCFNEDNSGKILLGASKSGSILNLDLELACSGFVIEDASGSQVGVVLFTHDISDKIILYGKFINEINLLVLGLLIIVVFTSVYLSRKSLNIEKRFKELFENSLDAIMIIEPPEWKFTDGNKATLNLFGLEDINELRSIAPGDLSPKYQPDGKLSSEKSKEMIGLAIKNGFHSFEWNHKKNNGGEFIALVSLSKIDNSNAIQAVVRNITIQKTSLESIKKSEEKALKSLKETEQMNRLMVGREIEMIELKKKIAELSKN